MLFIKILNLLIIHLLNHHAISLNAYFMNPSLIHFFNAVTEDTIDNQIIVTTAEAQNYPIYTVQYHPEAVLEPSQDINATRSIMGFKIAQQFGNFFASEYEAILAKVLVNKQTMKTSPFVNEPVNCYGIEYNEPIFN